MITNPEWLKPKIKPYFHQISLECIEEIAEYIESNDIEEMGCDTCFRMQEILIDEIDDSEFLEFAIENFSEIMGYIAQRNLNIRIHRDITGLPDEPETVSQSRKRLFCHSERSEESNKINMLRIRDSSAKTSEWHCDTVCCRTGRGAVCPGMAMHPYFNERIIQYGSNGKR